MYVPRQFSHDHREDLLAFIDAAAVGTLVTSGPGGLMANQVPLLRQPAADRLWGHLARPNPQLADMAANGEVLVVFNGPHGYISPNWYGDPQLVPTWNFVTVQVRGTVVLHDEPADKRDILERLTARHEAKFPSPWTMDKMDEERIDKMLAAIVGFHIEMSDVRGKYKLSQNRSASDRAGVIEGLTAVGNLDLAAMMQQQEDA